MSEKPPEVFISDAASNNHSAAAARHVRSPAWYIAASLVFVSVIVCVLVYLGMHERLVALLQWVEDREPWSAVLFILIMAAVVVLLLPGIFFTTGAGFVFGVVEGSIYVVLGTTLGAAVAFLLARYVLGERAARHIRSHSRLRVVNDEMARHDWKVVLLTRLIPFFPGKLSNYFFGLTSFSFRGYLAGSLIGFIPFSVHNAYLGSVAASLATLKEGGIARSPVEWGLYAAGFAMAVFAVLYCSRLARRALARYEQENGSEGLS